MRLSEASVDHVRDFLRSNLNNGIDQMNAAITDGITLDHFDPSDIKHGGGTILRYPALEIAVPDFQLLAPSVDNADWDETLNFILRGWVQKPVAGGDAAEQVYRLAQRLAQVILALVLPHANDAWGNHASCTAVRGAFRINPETQQKEETVSGFILVCTVDTTDQS